MGTPVQNEIVLVEGTEEFEVEISVADGTLAVGRFIETIAGVQPRCVLVDGFPVAVDRPVGELPIVRGSRLEALSEIRQKPVCMLIGLSGTAAAEPIYFPPGVHRVGCLDVGVQGRGIQGGAACLYVDVDGATRIDPGSRRVTIEKEPVVEISRLTPGDLVTIEGRDYRFIVAPPPTEARGRLAFNRPPRSEFPTGLPQLVAPGAPPAPQQPIRFGWGALVIPLLIGGLMALVWNPMMAMFAVFSPAMMLANWYEEKRRAGRANDASVAGLADAMADFTERLGDLRHAARVMAWRSSPGPARLVERIVRGDSRLWQRRHDHPDFLELAIGVGNLAWAPEVTPPEPDRAPEANELLAASAALHGVPVTVELGDGGVLGIVGHRRRQIEMARWLMVQAAAHHGPSDLAMLIVTDHAAEWDWLKWLPHLQIDGDGRRVAIVTPGETAEALLAPLLDAADDPAARPVRGGKAGPASLLLIDIEDVTTAAASAVRRVLRGEGRLRRAGIALGRTVEDLPSSCSDIVTLDSRGGAVLERPSRARRVEPIAGWRLAASAARRLARQIGGRADPDLSTSAGDLPDLVNLTDLIGPQRPSADIIVRRWAAAGPTPAPAAPIGATAEGPLVVDWAGDGPHALLAGTTGAGKSELLRSLVASLATSVDPEHLNFVLIDYKGGSAFDACAGLPHTVGVVTDLDGHLAQRALTCLEAELRHREEALRLVAAEDIDEYQRRPGGEPLPRLLVVIDEFAALARELPDFMAALVDIAQRGRSLGVHLLLATQRPNGVINDNIRANTNLRISLRVQDVADSMDVLGTIDAAGLPRSRPGRGFLRRGPGDIVAFQSAFVTGHSRGSESGVTVAPFLPAADQPAPAHLSRRGEDGPSDLEELVIAVTEAATKAGMRTPRLPWPDPLPTHLRLSDAASDTLANPSGRAVIGLLDEPHRQRRRPYSWATDSNIFIYGVQGSGTSSALITAISAACRLESPASLHAYLLDFDDQRLGVLEGLPHVGAIIGAGERDRQTRLLRYVQREVAERRELAATSPTGLAGRPRIIVGVDGFAGFRAAFDDPADMAIKESLGRIVADGPGVGVVVVATAKQPIDIPTQVASLVPTKLVMRLADRYEYTGLGVTAADLLEIPGRAFEAGTSLEVQLAFATADDIAEQARPVGGTVREPAPWTIESLPAEVKIPEIVAGAEVYELEWRIPVALGDDSLAPVSWTLRDGDHVLISGPARSGKSTALTTIAAVLRTTRPDIRITALTPRRGPLAECAAIDLVVRGPERLREAPLGTGSDQLHAILIDDSEDVDDEAGILAALIADRHPHWHIFAAGAGDVLRSAYGHWTQSIRRSRLGLALKPNPAADGDLWQTSLPRRGPSFFPPGRGYLIADGNTELCQVAWQ
jgi:S-DNA-T family DNA segregation ATPase FtsK/SpoIIIE